MKKVLLTSVLGCTLLTSAFADGNPDLTNTYGFTVIDYISITPDSYPFCYCGNEISKTFNENNKFDMTTPFEFALIPFSITASRSWHVTFNATDFERTEGNVYGADHNIAEQLPVGDIFSIKGVGTTANVTGTSGFQAVTNWPSVVISGKGGAGNLFNLTTKVDLSSAMTEYNIEGTYIAVQSVTAALD